MLLWSSHPVTSFRSVISIFIAKLPIYIDMKVYPSYILPKVILVLKEGCNWLAVIFNVKILPGDGGYFNKIKSF